MGSEGGTRGAGGLAILPAGVADDRRLRQVRLVYEEAFAPHLRVPFTELTDGGHGDQTVVAIDGGDAVAFASLRLLGSAGWSFLRYFAVARACRGQGTGRRFWHGLSRWAAGAGWPERITWEVEDPADAADDHAERHLRERRIAFWTACGARLLPVPGYVLPDYTGAGVTEPMLLMAGTPGAPPGAAEPPPQGAALRELVLAIYADRYGLPPDHPLAARAAASVAAG